MTDTGPRGIFQMNEKEKVLYVGEGVSWDTEWNHAVDLYRLDYSVWIHDHAEDARCRLDGARCKCGRLTGTTDAPRLDLVTRHDVEN